MLLAPRTTASAAWKVLAFLLCSGLPDISLGFESLIVLQLYFFSWFCINNCLLHSLRMVVLSYHLGEVNNLYSAQGNCSYHVVFMVRHPRGSYVAVPLLFLEVVTPGMILTH